MIQKNISLCVLATILLISTTSESAKILAVFPHTGKSHYFMFKPFVFKLAERGHHVHIITNFVEETPPANVTFTSLMVESETLLFNAVPMDIMDTIRFSRYITSLFALRNMGIDACEKLGHPNFQKFLAEKHEFDLLIVEFFNTDCYASLARVFNVPLIGIFSSAMMPWHNDRFGNPDNPAYIGNHFLLHKSSMSFSERTINTIATFFAKLVHRWTFDSVADAAVEKYIGTGIPPVREIVKNSSLFLLNSHFSLFQPRPLVPGIIELGGFHVTPATNNIPSDVLKFIEASENGVIFLSFGSTVRGSTMPKDKLKIFQDVLSKIPMRVIWKWEDDIMEGKPENVMLGKWLPQNEILGHPNVKIFITHAGLMGTEEAVYHGVPMLLIPLFGDQPLNAASVEEKGAGVVLEYFDLSEESLQSALQKLIYDRRYSENAKRLAKIFVDRPSSIMETAIYWTEYVIRYNGATHLRSAAVDLAWYEEYLLDVFVFLFGLFYLSYYIVSRTVPCFRH